MSPDSEAITRKYLAQGTMMQLATQSGGQPWCCTVYFVADDDLNLYWISKPDRRHSQEIEIEPRTAATIPISFVPGESVVGVQVQGPSSVVRDPDEIERAIQRYAAKFNSGDEFVMDFVGGNNPHLLYKLNCEKLVLFDEVSFPEDSRQEWSSLSK